MQFATNRFTNRTTRKFLCEIVTPMFIGGAEPKQAELRAASIKGSLRFWWRALYGSNNLNEMKERENEIFGSTDGKSKIKIKINANLKPVLKNLPKGAMFKVKGFSLNIIDYLAYGLYTYKRGKGNVYTKEFFEPQKHFEIILSYPEEFKNDILTSFKALIYFGGVGSRTRNGFGSLYCSDIENVKFQNLFDGELSNFTAFSGKSKIFLFNDHNTWVDVLSEIGLIYREARLSLEKRHSFFKRALLAMPIEARNENIQYEIKKGRHSKPYFLHVNKLKNGKFQGQILFLPYMYFNEQKQKEYLEVCKEMNNDFLKKAKEVKNEL